MQGMEGCLMIQVMVEEKPMKIYIAGKMRGVPYYNFPAFDHAKMKLLKAGHKAVSPADLDRENGFDPMKMAWPDDYNWNKIPDGFDFMCCVDRDIEAVKECDAILLLKGWESSSGARAEKALAEWLGKKILYEEEPKLFEVMSVDPDTGAMKGTKLARFDLIPAGPLWEMATHYGVGAKKYADRNWEKGYAWSKSFAAAMRHAWQFWFGEDYDPETKTKHVICAAWHFFALAEFMDTTKNKDDRPK